MSKWRRFKYLPVIPMGKETGFVTGCTEHVQLSRYAAAEGMVLLKNETKLLPLKKGSRIALFGKASVDYVKGGGGSGDVTVAYVRNLCDAMEIKQHEEKITVYSPLHDFYRSNVRVQRKDGKGPGYTIEPKIPEELLCGAAQNADIAIISICRFSTEARDRNGTPNDGDFYLSLEEQNMIESVCSQFDDVAVVLNVGGIVDTTWFIHNPKIKAVLLAWQGGQEGALAEADILCGDVCPSGKLTDTLAASFADYPSSYNFNESVDYVCYIDDIFVGYRYFETIPGAAEKVNYPFGFGLSYTTFRIAHQNAMVTAQQICLSFCVTNTGTIAGKEVVQLYVSAPKSKMDMPALELKAFQKTKLLSPNETQEITLTIPIRDLASYDETSASYVISPGAYKIYVGNSIRTLNEVFTYSSRNLTITQTLKNQCVPKKLPCRLRADGSYEALTTSEYPTAPTLSGWPAKANGDFEHILPNMQGVRTPADRLSFADVASGNITMEAFLDSLTNDEMITLLGGTPNRGIADTCGIGGLDYLGIPAVMTADGPAGLRILPDRGIAATAWPVATLLACSWDPELLYQIGAAGAKEVKENNCGVWLTPAINIHRSPLCGRNFEYYAEDPFLTGKLAAAMVRGIQSQSICACVKHFCANNKETNRTSSDSRVSERALREIYFKAFEIVVKEADVWAVMTSYNLLNGTYTSENQELLKGILRGEWGFDGLVVSDWECFAEQYAEVLATNNVHMPYGSPKRLQKALQEGLICRDDLICNVRRLLELLLKLE